MLLRLFQFSILLALVTAGLGGWLLKKWDETPIYVKEPQVLEVQKGEGLKELSQNLAKQGVVSNPFLFQVLVRILHNFGQFQAGTYRFQEFVSPEMVLHDITTGRVFNPLVLEAIVPEGYTAHQICDKLIGFGVGTKQQFTVLLKNKAFLSSLGLEKFAKNITNIEGFLFPATYKFYHKLPTPEEALKVMVEEFFKKLPENYEENLKKNRLSLYQGIIFASLIEKETAHEDERNQVSEVIWNRLKQNTPLGIDASIIYGIADYKGVIRSIHLQDAGNPYNSRIHNGLPPTPIASPSLESLGAVLTPTQKGYFFYVLEPGTDRHHHFSQTLKEHNLYVQKLVQFQTKKKQKESINRE